MITIIYLMVFIVSVIVFGFILIRYKKVNSSITLLCLSIVASCLGRYMIASSQSLETALWGNRILYVGACFSPLLILNILANLCNIRMTKMVTIVLSVYSTIIISMVAFVGYSDFYYEHVALGQANGYSYLIKSYGPMHVSFTILNIIYVLLLVFNMVFAIRQRKWVPYRTIITLGGICFTLILAYILENVFNMDISYMSFGYMVGLMIIIYTYERVNMYDMSSNVIRAMEQMKEYGYIVLDKKYKYISSNTYVKEIFPEIKEWAVEKSIPVSDSYLYQEVIEFFIDNCDKNPEAKTIRVGDLYLEFSIKDLSYGIRKVGYLIEFVNRTVERKYYNAIEDYNTKMEEEVEAKTADILHVKDMLVLGMADMVESRDRNTGGHIKRTSAVVRVFATKLKSSVIGRRLSENFLKRVVKVAPMHDLGKIAIDDDILRKPGKYTEEEYAEMKRHAAEGARIVENILRGVEDDKLVDIARNVAHYHHEKWNGQGYPCGLAGEAIPIEARIMALADVFDALVSKRCYKDAYSYERAFGIIEESLGEHFDPELGKVFLECKPELIAIYNSYENKELE